MSVYNFILLQTISTESYSYFSTQIVQWGVKKILSAEGGVILSVDNPLDFHDKT